MTLEHEFNLHYSSLVFFVLFNEICLNFRMQSNIFPEKKKKLLWVFALPYWASLNVHD